MSNIVTIVHNPTDIQVEINGREIPGIISVKTPDAIGNGKGHKIVTITFEAAMVNIVGVNAIRDTYFDDRDNRPKPLTRWQRFKAWLNRMERAFDNWQNHKYPDDDY